MGGTGPGWRLRGYAIEQLLGSGGGGEVWRGRALPSGDPVALKRIPAGDPEQVRRAHDEAALLTALDHQHIVRLHAVVPSDEFLVLVLDLADGGSLAALLAARGRLTPGEVITALAPVGAALAYLHGEGVVHGDVSAANILFSAAGRALLADVGTARLTGDTSQVSSTPAYVDPAVASGCVPGPQSDVFMLGAVALHALTGTPPWPGTTAAQALARAVAADLPDVEHLLAAADVPSPMAAVVCRALGLDPDRRGTAAGFALDLRHSAEPVAVELAAGRRARPPAGPRHAARPVVPERRRRIDRSEPDRPDFDRPDFDRPDQLPSGAGSAPPTSQVNPRPRPVIPRPNARRRPPRRAVLAGLVTLALVGGGAGWWVTRTPDAQATTDWAGRLAALDRTRAHAFATRDPALLAQVYRPGAALDADTALLTRIVPAGCVLDGASTTYRDVQASERGSTVQLVVVATLGESRLVCHGSVSGTAAGAGPTRLRIELVTTDAGLRIADEQLA